MTERCVVPNCKNSTRTGIKFPGEENLRKKWSESLCIPDFVPTTTSFVCLNHFDKADDASDKNLEDVLQTWSIPTVFNNKGDGNKGDEGEVAEDAPICRLCMNSRNVTANVYDYWAEEDITMAVAIMRSIPPIKVSKHDMLSKSLCKPCVEIIKLFYRFRNSCIKMDIQQRKRPDKPEKRKREFAEHGTAKKICVIPTSQVKAETETVDKGGPENPSENATIEEKSGSDELPLETKSEIDKKFDQVEAELMKALEGKLTEEMKNAENIIIEVHNEDDAEETNRTTNTIVSCGSNVVKIGDDEVKLPIGIKINPSKNNSKTGTFPATHIEEMFDTDLCLVDSYVFEYRLFKSNCRRLKCIVPKCASTGEQAHINGQFENQVAIKTPHNHSPPSDSERKKQIFFHIMQRKMQNDRSLDFRGIYDEICAKDPEIKELIPLRTVINQICCQQLSPKWPTVTSFDEFYRRIENDEFEQLHFTHANKQFYQEKLTACDGTRAIIFASSSTIERLSDGDIMYVDASFKLITKEDFKYHLVTVLVWYDESYFPILFALVSEKSQDIYKEIFGYLRDILAPNLRPKEIVTDYEACLYYALAETYLESHIGGSVFYYTQNLYKKICSLKVSRELETNSCFRNIYHMILMLPLLPVNTILDGLSNIETQANELGLTELTAPIFQYLRSEWIEKVTPELFCVHRLENRINENVIAPFKKLRDFLMLSKGKMQKHHITISSVVEKLIELEAFLHVIYSAPSKKSFARDLSSSQKKNVIRAWQFIESHPKIHINNFFTKVLGYIKCMENQLWIWGFYRYTGEADDELINAANFSIINLNESDDVVEVPVQGDYEYAVGDVVMDVIIDQSDGFLIKEPQGEGQVPKTETLEDAYL